MASAYAGSVAGLSVPGVGGGFAGPAEHGALGITFAPTASVLADNAEVAVDLGFLSNALSIDLDAWDKGTTYRDVDRSPQPTLMAVLPFETPVGRFGIGADFQVPYIRGGEEPADGPLRLFTISSTLQLFEEDLSLSYRPSPWFALGFGLRAGQYTYASTSGIDTGVTLNTALAPDPPVPIGDPLLQGRRIITPGTAVTWSWMASAVLTVPKGPEFTVAFRPAWVMRSEHRVTIVPSDDLNAEIDGRVEVSLALPAVLDVAARIPVGPLTLMPEVQWVGWQRTGRIDTHARDLSLASPDPALDLLLVTSGLSQADFVTSQEGASSSSLGWNNVINVGMQASVKPPATPLEFRAGLWNAPSAVPDKLVTPSNLDFARWDLRAGAAWQIVAPVKVGLSADVYPGSARVIKNSVYTQTDPSADLAKPSGNGRYSLGLWRAGLTLLFSIPTPGKG